MEVQNSPITILAGEALEAYRFIKFNGTAWVYADAADRPQALTANTIANGAVGPAILLNVDGIIRVRCTGTITAGDPLFTGADGVCANVGATPVGTAMHSATTGGLVEVMPLAANGGAGSIFQATYMSDGTPAATDRAFFVAPRPCRVLAISEVHAVAAGGASKLQVTKDTSTNAAGAGTNLLTDNTNAGFDLNATADTVQAGTLTATVASLTLATGDRLSVDYADTIQSTAGVCVTALLMAL